MPYYAKINGTDIRVNLYSAAPTYYPTQDTSGAACNLGSVSGGTATPFYANGTQIYIKPAGSWHTIWSGSQYLNISTDSSVDFNTKYTEFTSLSEQVKSTYKFKVTVSNNNGVTNDTIETDTGGKNYVEGSARKYVGYTVYPPTYLSNTSVRIRVKTTDTRSFYAPTMKATKIEAYY